MNREYKFRAWDKTMNSMHELVGFIQYKQFTEIHYGASGFRRGNESEFVLEQFTGLKDKNGVEIYEGDIVRILYTDWPSNPEGNTSKEQLEEYKKSISTIGYVSWDDYATGWVIRCKSKRSVSDGGTVMTSIIHGTHGEREVIGNIHTSPELLNATL